MPRCYTALAASRSEWAQEYRTPHVAILDPNGAMPGVVASRLSEFSREEAANTVLIVESPGVPPLWLEPLDLEAEEAIRFYAERYPGTYGGHRIPGMVRDTRAGSYVTTVDGTVNWVDWGTPAETWRGLIRREAGAERLEGWVAKLSETGRSLRPSLSRDRMVGLATFCLFFALAITSGWRISARSNWDSEYLARMSDAEPTEPRCKH
jgi:hypothetical protein